MSNIWIPRKHKRTEKDGSFVLKLEPGLQDSPHPLIWTPDANHPPPNGGPSAAGMRRTRYSSNDVFKGGNPHFRPWVVLLQVQLDGSGSNWESATWFVLAPESDPHEACRRGNHWWTRHNERAWRAAGNTGPVPPWPDTNGDAAYIGMDMDDWLGYWEEAHALCERHPSQFSMRCEGEIITETGLANARREVRRPMFWALMNGDKYHAMDFESMRPTNGVSPLMAINPG